MLKSTLVLLLFSGTSYAQQGFDFEILQTWYGSEAMLTPVLEVKDSACQGEVVLVRCSNCDAEDGLYWAVRGAGEIIRKTSTFIELMVLTEGSIRVSLERENFWGIGRRSVSIEASASPSFQLPATALICEGDSLELTLTEQYASYQWSDGPEGSSRQVMKPGIYGITVTGQNGCSSSKKIHIRQRTVPTPSLGPDRFTCNAKRPLLNPGSFTEYFWQNGSRDSSITADFPGTYWVKLKNECGLEATDTVKIIDKKLPQITLGEDQVLCLGDTLMLDAGSDYRSYRWNNGSRQSSCPVWASGDFTVTASDVSGCTTSASLRVEAVPCADSLTMPLRISPNGDQLNDQFILLNQQEASSLSLQIFSEDGLLLFFSDQKNQGWDGTFKQTKVPSGKYPYTIQYNDQQGSKQYLTGTLEVK